MIQVVRVSGTIRKAEEAAIRLARLSIQRAQLQRLQASGASPLLAQDAIGKPGGSSKGQDLSMEDASGFENGIEDVDEPGDEDEEDV